MNIAIIVAYLAPTLNTIQQLPQLYKVIVTKKVANLSFLSLLLILLVSILWFSHGYFIGDLPLMISSGIASSINLLLFTLFLTNRRCSL